MTTFNGRSYLSENELRLYDKLIKEYINQEDYQYYHFWLCIR